jgi:NDP-sugar pyrophosphorylase family protein
MGTKDGEGISGDSHSICKKCWTEHFPDIEYPTGDSKKEDLMQQQTPRELFVVRLYDGFDHIWMDISKPVSKEEAERILVEKTDNGTKKSTYDDIEYYAIFPADTTMLYSMEHQMRRYGKNS